MVILKSLQVVFRKPRTILYAIGLVLVGGVGLILYPNVALLHRLWQETGSITIVLQVMNSLIQGAPGSIGWISLVVLVLNVILSVVTFFIVLHAWRAGTFGVWSKTSGVATGGLLSALLGVGCAACGSLLAVGLLSYIGGVGLLAVLPLHGVEFGIAALGLLSYALYAVSKMVVKSPSGVCPL